MSLERPQTPNSNDLDIGNELEKQVVPIEYISNKTQEVSREHLKTIQNINFLKVFPENRLKYITDQNIDSFKLLSGETSEVKFDFHDNKNLYLMTTAGQIMPDEVRSIETSDGKVWNRSNFSLKGEFFDENNNRLIIGDENNTEFKGYSQIKVILGESENLNLLVSDNINSYLEKNKDKQKYFDIIKASIERGIDPSIAINIIGTEIDNLDISSSERKAKIEYILTGFDRLRGKYKVAENELNNFVKNYYVENRIEKIVSKDKVKTLIAKYFPFGNNYNEMEKAMRIIQGESRFDSNIVRPFWKNSTGNDLGLFQINDYYQRENMAKLGYTKEDMFDVEKNIEVAALAYKERGNTWKPWVAAEKLGIV